VSALISKCPYCGDESFVFSNNEAVVRFSCGQRLNLLMYAPGIKSWEVDAKESCRIIQLRNEISRLAAQRNKLLEYAKELSETLEQEYSSVYKELEDLIAEIEAEKGNKYRKAFYHPRGYGVTRGDDEEGK
jgi:vacuolar-type H+-ATPase subunit I/STV1